MTHKRAGRPQSGFRPVKRGRRRIGLGQLVPFAGLCLIPAWSLLAARQEHPLLPGPWKVLEGLWELTMRGLLLRHVTASLFRVTWGYLAAVLIGVPLGLWLGFNQTLARSVAWLLQGGRMLSPLAWIPISILWFGVGDPPALFIVFIGAFFPVVMGAMHAARRIDPVHVSVGRNFGLSRRELLRHVILPGALPELVVTLRLALGIAWLVVVAAEMIAVSSGLGFLIVDARNSGNRYDLVVAGIVMIAIIGVVLGALMRRMENLSAIAWARRAEGGGD